MSSQSHIVTLLADVHRLTEGDQRQIAETLALTPNTDHDGDWDVASLEQLRLNLTEMLNTVTRELKARRVCG